MRSEVLVVGAGPAGLVLAGELSRYGMRVRLIDRQAKRGHGSKALLIWSRTLELLDRGGWSAPLLASGHRIDAANILAGDHVLGRVDFALVNSPHPYALTLPQAETERALEAALSERGVNVERGVELVTFSEGEGGVRAELLHADGHVEAAHASWLVGCDGAASKTRQALGVPMSDHTQRSAWLLADVELSSWRYPENELVSFWQAAGFLAIFPIGGGRYRVIADLAEDGGGDLPEPSFAQLHYIILQRGPAGLQLGEPGWLSTIRIHERNAREYQVGHVFLAGDAAHVHSPAGGQGMNMGIQDAVNLAWKLAMVAHGQARVERVLPSYGVERHAAAEQVLANVSRLTAISVVKNAAFQLTRNILGSTLFGLAPARRAIADQLSEVSLGYASSPLNGPQDHGLPGPGPGERVPPAAGEAPFGADATPRFALLADPGDAAHALLEKYAGLLEPRLRPPLYRRCAWLVRPDGYVAMVAMAPDMVLFDEYLRRIKV